MDILNTVKMLLNIADTSQDDLLNYQIKRVTDAILNYCHRDDLPTQLESIIVDKVTALHKAHTGMLDDDNTVSITRGNTTIQYAQKQSSNVLDIVSDIAPTLDRFRKVKVL